MKTEVHQYQEERRIDKDHIEQLQREVSELKEACAHFVDINRQHVSTPEVKPWLKPRDVQVLELGHLQDVEGEGRLTTFLSQIEHCAHSNEKRKKILTTKLNSHLNILVQAMVEENPDIKS